MTHFHARPHEVHAMLAGEQFCIVRPLKPQPKEGQHAALYRTAKIDWQIRDNKSGLAVSSHRPIHAPGDMVVVKETFCPVDDLLEDGKLWVDYRATPRWSAVKPAGWDQSPNHPEALNWRSPAIMPSWASRLTLTVTDVQVKRLQEATTEEAIRAGTLSEKFLDDERFVESVWAEHWSQHHPKTPWDSNPWCVFARCRVHRCNINDVKGEAA